VEERREIVLTAAFVGACLVLAAIGLAPHLHVRRAPPVPATPDLEVAVSGAVAAPGRYRLPWGARVADLIAAAGGVTPAAAEELVNPAAPLANGVRVHVPARGAPGGEARVSINAADPRLLETLPGIGPALAARIVAARPFHDVDDLLRVRGIGPATLERLRSAVRL
jgi:competence protein ComEA